MKKTRITNKENKKKKGRRRDGDQNERLVKKRTIQLKDVVKCEQNNPRLKQTGKNLSN